MKPLALSLLAFVLLGCTVSTAQTSYDQEQDARIRALELLHGIGTTTGGTTTGGTTTGGTTTGGTTTGGSTTGGTTGGDPDPTQRTIFATTHETGPSNMGGWEAFGYNVQWNSGTGQNSIVEVSNAKSGRYVLRQTLSGGSNSGARMFVMWDHSSGSQKPLPMETTTTAWIKIPTRYNVSFLILAGWKQNGFNKSYNQNTVALEFGSGQLGALRLNVKGRTSSAATSANNGVQNYYVNQTSPRNFPINQWVKVTLYAKHTTGNDGRFTVWQDDVLILDYQGKTMRANAPNVEFELTNYGPNVTTSIDYDDVTLTTPN